MFRIYSDSNSDVYISVSILIGNYQTWLSKEVPLIASMLLKTPQTPPHNPTSPIRIHKLLMKLRNSSHPFRSRRQKRRAEMQRPLLLPKARTRHNTNPRCV
jgi:hypothetical protein